MSTLNVNTINPQSGSTLHISGNMKVSGTIDAYEYKTIVETTYRGATIFGNSSADVHQFTGSLFLTGPMSASSVNVTGNADIQGDTVLNTLTVSGSMSGSSFALSSNAEIYGNTAVQGDLSVSGSTTLGDSCTDVITLASQVTASCGIRVTGGTGNKPRLIVGDGTAEDTLIVYDGNEIDYYIGIDDDDDKLHFGEGTVAGTTTAFTIDTGQRTHFLGDVSGSSNFNVGGLVDIQKELVVNRTITASGSISGSANLELAGNIEVYANTAVGGNLSVTGSTTVGANVLPKTDNSINLGSASKRFANIFTGDLHLKNDRGDWTILEERDYLCVINNTTGKKFKMMLQEIED